MYYPSVIVDDSVLSKCDCGCWRIIHGGLWMMVYYPWVTVDDGVLSKGDCG